MLDLLTATRFDRRVGNGRTKPCRIACESLNGDEIEVVVKFSAGCEHGVVGPVFEAIAGVLAADLNLPVPEPFLVAVTPEFVESITDAEIAALAQRSAPVAFGSKALPPGFSVWPTRRPIAPAVRPIAADVLAFDMLIGNFDRRPENPNCLVKGDEIAIFDHELSFPLLMIGWRPPWEVGAMRPLQEPGYHLFSDGLRKKPLDFSRLQRAWQGIGDDRLLAYSRALPPAWAEGAQATLRAVKTIADVREHIEACLAEIGRALG